MDSLLESYLEVIRAGLAKSKCRHASAQILQEARAHLEESVEELLGRGMTRERAEQIAVERFGDADAVCRWYAEVHRRPSMWRAARGPLVMLAVFVVLGELIRFVPGPGIWMARLTYINLFVLGMSVACFRAKRMVLPALAAALAGASLLSWIGFVCFAAPCPGDVGGYYPIARGSVPQRLAEARRAFESERELVSVLERGSAVFAADTAPADMGAFRSPEGLYRTPIYFEIQARPLLTAYVNGQVFHGETTSWSEAKMFWAPQRVTDYERAQHLDVSPYVYVRSAVREMRVHEKVLRELPKLAEFPPAKRARLFVSSALFLVALPMFAAVIGDVLAALVPFLISLVKPRNRLVAG